MRRDRGLVPLLLLLVLFSTALAAAERDIRFENGDVVLHGTLMLPDGPRGAAPAVVFLHGSGPATREGARPYAVEFARLGLASLCFDKRGSGKSGGDWTTSSLQDLAADALAAVAFLQQQPGIDAKRIGFWGVSQAAWVATLAASESSDVAFMVLVSGGGASPRESELFSYERAFESAGLSASDRVQARTILADYFAYLATGEKRAALVAQLESLRGGSLEPLTDVLLPIVPSEPNRRNWEWVATWDPAPATARLRMPVLLLFGALDNEHPTDAAVRQWREGLRAAGNERATIVVFPEAGHGARLARRADGSRPHADGYQDVMLGWLWRTVVAPSGS